MAYSLPPPALLTALVAVLVAALCRSWCTSSRWTAARSARSRRWRQLTPVCLVPGPTGCFLDLPLPIPPLSLLSITSRFPSPAVSHRGAALHWPCKSQCADIRCSLCCRGFRPSGQVLAKEPKAGRQGRRLVPRALPPPGPVFALSLRCLCAAKIPGLDSGIQFGFAQNPNWMPESKLDSAHPVWILGESWPICSGTICSLRFCFR